MWVCGRFGVGSTELTHVSTPSRNREHVAYIADALQEYTRNLCFVAVFEEVGLALVFLDFAFVVLAFGFAGGFVEFSSVFVCEGLSARSCLVWALGFMLPPCSTREGSRNLLTMLALATSGLGYRLAIGFVFSIILATGVVGLISLLEFTSPMGLATYLVSNSARC